MPAATPPPVLVAQRLRLADLLERMPAPDWDGPTLCEGWTVRHVVAHAVMGLRYSRRQFVAGLLKHRGEFNRFADTVARKDGAALIPAQLVAVLRDNAHHPYQPPGGGFDGALTDLVVHTLDIAHPRGIADAVDPDAYPRVLDQLATARSLKFFSVDVAGRRLRATDVDWSHGDGPDEIAAPAAELVLALGARPVALVLGAAR